MGLSAAWIAIKFAHISGRGNPLTCLQGLDPILRARLKLALEIAGTMLGFTIMMILDVIQAQGSFPPGMVRVCLEGGGRVQARQGKRTGPQQRRRDRKRS